ncbi:lipopolysaccharide biosynthesis protein [Aurantiacibacter poecillastricola]|uniref:lipopolysaccharide biosynthesis protein n=1 Tax=Aurantiacibacter poecillastricola TaxID=3064385 RepID=UPI00273F2A5E|nr:lipopolysaccharide biosynthesis protein [Aurantiacibacter sp. 219JJ12-13]MDP5263242.1 lipopolysaccharide biosynthesis protein [Aurantiacibacter sp. 219JJ12-13]
MSSKRALLLKGASWLALARIAINLLAFASTLILARLLVPEDFGLVAIAEAFAIILVSITELSLAQALIRHDNPEEHHFHTAWTLNFARSVGLAAIMAGLSFPAAAIYGDPRLAPVLLVLAGGTLLGGLENPKLIVFQRKLVFWQEFVLSVGAKVAAFVVAIGIAVAFRSYWALILGGIAGGLARVALSYVLIPYRPRFGLSAYRDLLSFSIWLTFAQAIEVINKRSVPIAIGLVVSTASLGQYAMGVRLAQMPVREGISPVRKMFFPAFASIKNDIARLRAAYLRAQESLCTLAFPIAGGLTALAEPAVRILIGEKWLPAVPIIQVISLAAALEVMESTSALAMAVDRTKALFERNLRAFLIRIPLILLGGWLGSLTLVGIVMGVVYGRSLASVINMIWNMQLVRDAIGLRVRRQLAVGLRPAIATGAMMVALLVPLSLFPITKGGVESAFKLIGLVAFGAATYIAMLAVVWLAAGQPEGPEAEALRLGTRLPQRLRRQGAD